MCPDFVPTKLEHERDEHKNVFTMRLTGDWRTMLDEDKKLLEQPKDSTCMKQLALIGHNVLHGKETGLIIRTLFKNKRNNKRMGIVDYE